MQTLSRVRPGQVFWEKRLGSAPRLSAQERGEKSAPGGLLVTLQKTKVTSMRSNQRSALIKSLPQFGRVDSMGSQIIVSQVFCSQGWFSITGLT